MKKIALALTLTASLALVSQAQMSDSVTMDSTTKDSTVKVDISKGGVLMTEEGMFVIPPDTGKDSVQSIELRLGSDGGLQYFDGKNKTPRDSQTVKTAWMTLDLGFNNLANSSGSLDMPAGYEDMELNPGKSIHVEWGFVQQGLNLYRYKLRFVYGLGFTYNNYRFTEDVILNTEANPLTTSIDSGANYQKNKLTAKYATVPIFFNYESKPFKKNKSFTLALGGKFSYLMNSYQKTKNDGQKDKTYDTFNLEPIRLTATARIGYAGFNFYVNYGLTELFKDGAGPAVTPISFGLGIINF